MIDEGNPMGIEDRLSEDARRLPNGTDPDPASDPGSMSGREPAATRLDAVIRGGTVLDGTGRPGRSADVGILNGGIVAVGDLAEFTAEREIDASGLFVAPGFIDVHAHTDVGVLVEAASSLTQGVTTETLGPDGWGRFDIAAEAAEIARAGISINVAPYVGFNTVWEHVVGAADVRPTDADSRRMQALFVRALEEGAWGVSSGLGYFPARYSSTEEVIRALGDLSAWRTMFSDHVRDETDLVVPSVEENLVIGAGTGLMAAVTHMKIAGPLNWGASRRLLELQAEARASGHHAGGDVYPYTAASTGLNFYVPGWAQDGGTELMLRRFADPAARSRAGQEISDFVRADVGDPGNVSFPTLGNRNLADLMVEYGGVSSGEAVIRALEEHRGILHCVMQIGSEADLRAFLADPFLAVSSDGGASDSAEVHPRHYGTFPRFLGRYVREQGVVPWAEGVRKLTGLPATMLGLVDRGFLAPGMAADVTVFDPETIIDHAEFGDPRRYSSGVEYVFVNGKLALEQGRSLAAGSGSVLLRSSGMPTRVQVADQGLGAQARGQIAVASTGAGAGAARLASVDIELRQEAGADAAAGTLAIVLPGTEEAVGNVRLGVLQTAPGWFTVSGVGVFPGRGDQTFQVIVDRDDPLALPGETTVTLHVDGAVEFTGALKAAAG